MKKSIIALAVAGALVAPLAQADATLYGSLRVKVTNYDNGELDVSDNVSRVGIKGSSELFSGAKAIFQFEEAANTESGERSGRLALIGATGDFGTVTMGRQWTPFYLWTATTDILDNGSSGASVGFGRVPNTVAYITPNLSGFQAAAVVIANEDAAGEDVDRYNLAAKYAVGGLTVSASIVTDESATAQDTTAVAASYSMDAFTVAARFQDDERNVGNEDSYELAGTYSMGNTTLLANYIDDDNETDETWSLEVQQKLGKQARVFAAYVDEGDNDGIEVGYRVDF